MYVDVTVQKGRTGRIALHEGDNLKKLCKNFAKVYQLAPEASQQLEGMLQKAYADRPPATSAPAASVLRTLPEVPPSPDQKAQAR
jgi:hypothetical protein